MDEYETFQEWQRVDNKLDLNLQAGCVFSAWEDEREKLIGALEELLSYPMGIEQMEPRIKASAVLVEVRGA